MDGAEPRRATPSPLPNLLTGLRLALLPLLWVAAGAGASRVLAIGIGVAALTDVIDGSLARWLDSRTEVGSRLDSLADHLLTASVLSWLVWLRPELVARHLPVLILWAGFGTFTLAVGWVRFRRIGDLHLYSAKAAGVLGYLLVVWVFYFDVDPDWPVRIVIAACFVATGESLLVYLTRRDPDERIGSILLRRRA